METRNSDQCAPAANNKQSKKKTWAYLYMPILYTLIVSFLFVVVVVPFRSTVLSWIDALSSPVTYTNTELTSIFKGYTPPTSDDTQDPPQEETVSCRDVEVPYYNTQYARITCEDIGVDCALYFGDSTAALKKGAGQYAGSYLPGYNGHILVCAHNTSYFKPLQYVEVGHVFTVTTNYGIYQYEVTETKVLNHKDDSAYDLSKRDEEQLILYTCYPFYRMSSVKTDRLFVICKKIAGPRVVEE